MSLCHPVSTGEVSLAEYSFFYRALLQKRPRILRVMRDYFINNHDYLIDTQVMRYYSLFYRAFLQKRPIMLDHFIETHIYIYIYMSDTYIYTYIYRHIYIYIYMSSICNHTIYIYTKAP